MVVVFLLFIMLVRQLMFPMEIGIALLVMVGLLMLKMEFAMGARFHNQMVVIRTILTEKGRWRMVVMG
jgi:hypothetical protein